MPDVISVALNLAAFGAALWILYFGWSRYRQLSATLTDLKVEIDSCTSLLIEVHDTQTFSEAFDDIDTRIRSTPVVGGVWSEFASTLLRLPDGVMATRRSSEYFGPDLPYRSGTDLRRFDAVPNQLVGIGLFFTFVGLAISLWIARTGMERPFDEARGALVNLMSASSIKFVTSIVAIAASLAFAFRKNTLLRELDTQTERFCRQIERLTLTAHVTPILNATYSELCRQSEILERSDADMATSIAQELDRTLRENLVTAIAPVADAINDMAGRINEINETAMRYIVDRFTQELGSAAREHSARMAELLDQVARAVEGVPERIEAASSRFYEVINTASDRMETSLRSSGEVLDGLLSGAAKGVAKSAEAFDAVSVRLDQSLEQVRKAGEEFSESSGRFSEMSSTAVAQLSEAAERMGRASDAIIPLAELSGRVEALGEQLIRSQQATTAYLTEVEAASSRMDSSFKGSESALAELLGRTTDRAEAAAAAFTTVAVQLNGTLERLSAAEETIFDRGVRFSEMSQSALAQLTDAAEKVAKATEAMAPLGGLSTSVQSLSEDIVRSSREVAGVAAAAERSLATSREAADSFAEQSRAFTKGLADLEAGIAAVFDQVGHGIETFRSKVEGAVEGVDASLAQAVDRLGAVVERIGDKAPRRGRPAKVELVDPEAVK
jgi:ABC-type transporter Mla subunit MlaD